MNTPNIDNTIIKKRPVIFMVDLHQRNNYLKLI